MCNCKFELKFVGSSGKIYRCVKCGYEYKDSHHDTYESDGKIKNKTSDYNYSDNRR